MFFINMLKMIGGIFGGPVPLPVTVAVIGFIFLGLLGAAAEVVFLCLLDTLAGAQRRRR